jgi:CubicO group peptidase (beta-lactamase class C family)
VERGLIGLDESVSKVLPELGNLDIISWKNEAEQEFELRKAKNSITVRHLLTHSSGLTYDITSPLVMAWRKSRGEKSLFPTHPVPEAMGIPLLFEPGEGWVYGGSTDWAGYVVQRLNNNISLEEYFVENIFKKIGCAQPYPTFDLNKHPEAKANLVHISKRSPSGELSEGFEPFAESPPDEGGGAGLASTADHFVAVLADIISDSPKVLNIETATALFTPQLSSGSSAYKGLLAAQMWDPKMVGDQNIDKMYNFGLGGLCYGEEVVKIGQPDAVLAWGGAANLIWFASRKHGVAGFAGTQIMPPGDKPTGVIFEDFRKDFWDTWKSMV